VTGYLDKVLFKEGTEVKAGDLLFEIDPRPYRAALHSAEGTLAQDKATLDLAKTELARADQLLPTNAISGTDYDQVKNAVEVAKARVQSGEAAVETAKLNLEFCSIRAPISGRISRQLIDPGNLVQADQTAPTTASTTTAMTTIVSLDPIYAYFDVDERTMLRVRLPIGTAHSALLVSEQAFGTDQGQRFVYVVNDKNEVVYRRVKVGPLQDGLRVIEEGLAQGERVVISGLQRIKSGDTVEPKDASARSVGAAPPPATKPEPASGAR
jgi:multidrug efflux pump subunit AcrA (membrane-fusion protein)